MSVSVKGNKIDKDIDGTSSEAPIGDDVEFEDFVPESLSDPEDDVPAEPDTDAPVTAKRPGRRGRLGTMALRGSGKSPRVALLFIAGGLILAALLAGAGYQYWGVHTSNQQVEQIQNDIGRIAADGAVAVLSYKFDTVDQDLERAQSLLTGQFADYYKNFTAEVVVPAAKEKKVNTEANIAGSAVEQADSDRAVALVFVNQSTVTADNASPTLTASSVRVELQKIDGKWLIEKFDPV